mmetsp:Transcript_3618/g.7013  ORF Transcript_3618/g.7013 Transcript_3618/m.7013 type:complete len:211 (-) Transcript_3618:398-1030(-)
MALGYRPTWACPAGVHRASSTPSVASKPPKSPPANAGGAGLMVAFLPDDGIVTPLPSPPAPPSPGEENPPSLPLSAAIAPRPAALQRASASDSEKTQRRRKSVPSMGDYYAQQQQHGRGLAYRPTCAFPTMRNYVKKCFEAAEEPIIEGEQLHSAAGPHTPPSLPASPPSDDAKEHINAFAPSPTAPSQAAWILEQEKGLPYWARGHVRW